MKRTILAICLIALLCASNALNAVKTVYIPRSQGHAPSMTCMPAYDYALIMSLNYGQSYHNNLIACDLFGTSKLTISGSQVPNRAASDLLADNFGLAPDFQSTLTFKPSIENLVYALYFNKPLDYMIQGLYVNFMFPIAYSSWTLNPCEKVTDRGSSTFPAGYMATSAVATGSSAQQYFTGNLTTGDIIRPLAYNKISWCPLKRTELAELIVRLGRNFVITDYALASFFIRASFQTGNKLKPEYLFAPVVGNGQFFELGAGFQGQWRLTNFDNPTNVTVLWDFLVNTFLKINNCVRLICLQAMVAIRVNSADICCSNDLLPQHPITRTN